MAHVLSEDAKLYYNTGSYASPTWSEIDNVKDLTLSQDKGEVDLTTRASGGYEETGDGLISISVEFSMLYDTAEAYFGALEQAFTNKTAVEFAVMDGPIATTGSEGLRATCMVKTFSRNESLGDALMMDIVLRPVKNSDAPPVWYTVS